MRKIIFLLALFTISGPYAQEGQELVVTQIVTCTEVEAREPVGVNTVFPDTVGTLYCYTEIKGALTPTKVKHIWYHLDEERASIELDVKSETWRTWSSKRIIPQWAGKWRIDVVDAKGDVLKSHDFTIESTTF
jgi:hypothetical protein